MCVVDGGVVVLLYPLRRQRQMCIRYRHYAYNINIPVRHNDPESIDNIRGALHYLAKEEQKDGLCAYGCNEVPERPAAGRPRKPHF